MAKVSEQSLGWALLTTACLGLAVIATVARPHQSPPHVLPSIPLSQPSLAAPNQSDHQATHEVSQVVAKVEQRVSTARARTLGLTEHRIVKRNKTLPALPESTTTTVPQFIPTTSMTTTTTTQPIVQMASPTPHGVGYVAQPLAALASYDVTALDGGEFTISNESAKALLVTVDHGKVSSLEAATSLTVKLSLGLHQFDISASSTSPQSYAIDGTLVSW